jgi:hypothetical protein
MLADAQIPELPPDPLGTSVRDVVAGLSVVLWACGTWLIPAAAGGRGVAPPAAPGEAGLRAGFVERRLPGRHIRGGEPRAGQHPERVLAGDAGTLRGVAGPRGVGHRLPGMAGALLRSARLQDPSAPASW